MKLSHTAHTARPWRIHEIAHDFRVEDVWALPTPGGPHDLPRLVALMTSGNDPSRNWSPPARMLWQLRWKLGALFGWDDEDARVGTRVPSLRERMPPDLRDVPTGPAFSALPFTSLYQLEDEWAAEMANRTVHTVMHIGWVPDGAGGHRGQMAVLVKPNGLFGTAYMTAIAPLRHRVVYPTMLTSIGRQWRTTSPSR
ncbi:MAG TPA: DUF2867 domain-containing protein [Pseudonocardia sp.]|nr:DUF2867 domain-containing protein [Pseudonocardia sp.]